MPMSRFAGGIHEIIVEDGDACLLGIFEDEVTRLFKKLVPIVCRSRTPKCEALELKSIVRDVCDNMIENGTLIISMTRPISPSTTARQYS